MISSTYPWLHLERFDCFPIFVRHRFPSPRRRAPARRPRTPGALRSCGDNARQGWPQPLSDCPVMVAISGTSHPGSCQARHGRPAYVVERKLVWYVRLRACLAPTRAEAVLRPCRIVRGSGDHGRHAVLVTFQLPVRWAGLEFDRPPTCTGTLASWIWPSELQFW
jgi:hypothetical protein